MVSWLVGFQANLFRLLIRNYALRKGVPYVDTYMQEDRGTYI